MLVSKNKTVTLTRKKTSRKKNKSYHIKQCGEKCGSVLQIRRIGADRGRVKFPTQAQITSTTKRPTFHQFTQKDIFLEIRLFGALRLRRQRLQALRFANRLFKNFAQVLCKILKTPRIPPKHVLKFRHIRITLRFRVVRIIATDTRTMKRSPRKVAFFAGRYTTPLRTQTLHTTAIRIIRIRHYRLKDKAFHFLPTTNTSLSIFARVRFFQLKTKLLGRQEGVFPLRRRRRRLRPQQ